MIIVASKLASVAQGIRAMASGAMCAGSNPAGGTNHKETCTGI